MKPLTIRLGESPPKVPIPQPDHTPALAREKLSDLTHRIQLVIRNKPKDMLSLLEFYQYFLSVKEDLEHFFTREQALLKSLNQAGSGPGAGNTPDNTLVPGKVLARLKEELSDFVVLLSNIPIHYKGLKTYSLVLSLFFKELENFIKLLDAHNDQLSYAFLLVPPPAGTIARAVPFVPATGHLQDRIPA